MNWLGSIINNLNQINYHLGGMTMKGRNYSTTSQYRYGFNGKEKDNDPIQYDYGFRIYDPRLVRFKSVDPLASSFPHMSPYSAFNNNPLRFTDPTGAASEDWIKNTKTGKYEWRNDVTSASNSPAGYSYVGKQNNDIVIDLGYSTAATTVTSIKTGVIHTDVQEGDVAKHIGSYTAGHTLSVKVSTTAQVSADVTTTFDKGLNMSKTFNGLSENISMRVTTSTEEVLTTSAEVNFKLGGQAGQLYLTEPAPSPNGNITQPGTAYLNCNITMTPGQAALGTSFSSLNISGTFFRPTNEGPAYVMPSILSGQLNILAPLKYSQYIPPIISKR